MRCSLVTSFPQSEFNNQQFFALEMVLVEKRTSSKQDILFLSLTRVRFPFFSKETNNPSRRKYDIKDPSFWSCHFILKQPPPLLLKDTPPLACPLQPLTEILILDPPHNASIFPFSNTRAGSGIRSPRRDL